MTTEVARPRRSSSTFRETRPRRVGNSTEVPTPAKATPAASTSSVGAAAMTAAPAVAASAPARRTVRSCPGRIPPRPNRPSATVPANSAGPTADRLVPAPRTSWAKTPLQFCWAFSAANASAPSSPIAASGRSAGRPAAEVSAGFSGRAAKRAGRAVSIATPAITDSAATTTKGIATGEDTADARPVPRPARTTEPEKTPWARVMTGRPAVRSAPPATALIATSAAPLTAPVRASPAHSPAKPTAPNARTAPATPRAAMAGAAVLGPQRSSARPIPSIAGSAPAPMNNSANPSWPSLIAACSRTRGTEAPHVPQNAPNAAKATNVARIGRRGDVAFAGICVTIHICPRPKGLSE